MPTESESTSQSIKQRRWFYRFRKPLLAIFSTIIALGLAEFAIRLLQLTPQVHAIDTADELSAYIRSNNPILRYEIKPKFAARFHVGRASTNSHGLRDVERSVAKPDGVRRVLILGDSVVEGINYVGDEETISRQMESLFEDGTEVLNFGTSGYCTLAEVELLKKKGLKFDPDVVIVVFIENDFQNFNPEHAMEGGIVERPASVKWLFQKCHLFRFTCIALNWYRFRDEVDPAQWNHQAIGEENNVVTGLRELRRLADQHNFAPYVAIWPSFADRGILDFHQMPEGAGDLIVERLAWANDIPTIRLSREFEKHWKNIEGNPSARETYTVRNDMMHPNPVGCRVAAEILRKVLTDPSVTESKPTSGATYALASQNAKSAGGPVNDTTRPVDKLTVLAKQGRSAEALEILHQRLKENPNDFVAHFKIGVTRAKQKKVDLAIEHLERATKIKPADYEPYFYLALVYQQAGDQQKAMQAIQAGRLHLPDNVDEQSAIQAAFIALTLQAKLDEPRPIAD